MKTKKKPLRLDARLMSAAPFVRGGVLADIGTDHAYLPIRLLQDGLISSAVASDINKGPLEHAEKTVREYGMDERVSLVLTDGLCGIEKYNPRDIIIFGMGGELIASIIDAAPWVRNPDIRLILQPMTRRAELREYLLRKGHNIIDEVMSGADGRIYQTVCTEYDGIFRRGEYSTAELMLGRYNIARGGELLRQYAGMLAEIYEVRKKGKETAGADTSEELAVIDAVLPYTKETLF